MLRSKTVRMVVLIETALFFTTACTSLLEVSVKSENNSPPAPVEGLPPVEETPTPAPAPAPTPTPTPTPTPSANTAPTKAPAEIHAISTWGVADRTYSISEEGATVWSVPSGWTIVSGQGSNSIDVTVPQGGENGTLSVAFTNEYGAGPTKEITVEPVRPGVISRAVDLQAINTGAETLEATYIQAIDIDLEGYNWKPIGSEATPFSGIYDGANFKISNLTINRETETKLGLFGKIHDGGEIGIKAILKNINLENVKVNEGFDDATITSSEVGGLVGNAYGTIQMVRVQGYVACSLNCGLLVGFSSSNISQTAVDGTLVATIEAAGGIVGDNRGNISESRANIDVRSGYRAGGITALNYPFTADDWADGNPTNGSPRHLTAEITDCYATGTVTQTKAELLADGSLGVGGLVGRMDTGLVLRSYAKVDVTVVGWTGNWQEGAGGVVGDLYAGFVENSFSAGNVSGVQNVGGLAGFMGRNGYGSCPDFIAIPGTSTVCGAVVQNSHATGNVNGNSSVGGLVGRNMLTISRSWASGNVNGAGEVGGLVGLNFSDNNVPYAGLWENYATGNVSGGDYVGGFVGKSAGYNTLAKGYSSGTVTSPGVNKGGFAGYTGEFSYYPGGADPLYYLDEISGLTNGPAVSKTLADLITATSSWTGTHWTHSVDALSTMHAPSWDFDSIWTEQASGYHTLKWETE